MKIKVFIITACLLLSGCSTLNFYTVYHTNDSSGRTSYFPISDRDSICFSIGRKKTSGLVGLPFIPFFPFGTHDSPYEFKINVGIKPDSSHSGVVIPDVRLLPRMCKSPIKPKHVAWDESFCDYTLVYDLRDCYLDTIKIIYVGDKDKLDLPPITFYSADKIEYRPVDFETH